MNEKPTPQIKYFSSGKWHDIARAEAAQMMRESRSHYDCDQLFLKEYILHEEYCNSVFIRTRR